MTPLALRPLPFRRLATVALSAAVLVASLRLAPSMALADDDAKAQAQAPVQAAGEEFDRFWAERVADFKTAPLNATVKHWKDVDGISLSTVYFDSIKDVRIHGYLAVPAGEGKHPGLVIVPGLGDHARSDWALEAAKKGYAALTIDLRGQGKTKGAIPDVVAMYKMGTPADHFFPCCIADVLRSIDLLASRDEVNADWLFIEGFSLGGGLTLAVSSLEPRIKAAAIGAPAFCDFETSVRDAKDPRMLLLRAYLASLKNQEDGMRQLRLLDNSNFATRIKVPVLFSISRRDPVISYDGVRKTYERVPGTDKELLVDDAPVHRPTKEFYLRADSLFRRVRGEQAPVSGQ
ncbi:MAG: alpha/beta fold hydrolase [Planctomycetes bacterium]|nr:alpha/beta fold hydrolase [Planctomycetota bacterium]